MKKIIVVANQKGGVGKTTTVINIASGMARYGKKILVIDLDPQGNATTGCGIEKSQLKSSIYDVLILNKSINDCIVKSEINGFDILPANRNLSGAEIELIELENREYCLKNQINQVIDKYDTILIDCPPSLSLLTLNALVATEFILIPIQCEFYALEGLADLLSTIKRLQINLNPNLELLGLVRTMYDKRNKLALQVSNQLTDHFGSKVFKTFIPRNVRLAESPSYGLSSIVLDGGSLGAQAYLNLTKEINNRLRGEND